MSNTVIEELEQQLKHAETNIQNGIFSCSAAQKELDEAEARLEVYYARRKELKAAIRKLKKK